jgi:lipid II:glycine glycyltransferase (peptidoglycan interpeptide bridge formation enzyme)
VPQLTHAPTRAEIVHESDCAAIVTSSATPTSLMSNPGNAPRTVVLLNPLTDVRWTKFVQSHPAASVFHSPGWLDALRRTYGYSCVTYALESSGELVGGLVCCWVRSWLTGTRLVSVPFADHCEPLVNSNDEFDMLMQAAKQDACRNGANFVEVRPLSLQGANLGLVRSESFCFHMLDLTVPSDRIFAGFHKDCVQRKVRRAERENLQYECGATSELIEKFYRLMLMTRRRQQLPPQPLAWFRNLVDCMPGSVSIHLASTKNGQTVASIFTLRNRDTMVYKYGCSDVRFNAMGATQLLFWRAIQDGKSSGVCRLDLGRSDLDNHGLVAFKDRLGATRTELHYWRSGGRVGNSVRQMPGLALAKSIFTHMPDRVLTACGTLLYKHSG